MNSINGFRGEYDFLSNFYPCRITFYEMTFSSVEAAYQAAKCADRQQRNQFCSLSASEAKRLGRTVELRPDWEQRKLTIMNNLLVHKFQENPELQQRLLATGAVLLVESNTWHDNYWGNCTCSRCSHTEGRNMLGRLLMEIRLSYLAGCTTGATCFKDCPIKTNTENCWCCDHFFHCDTVIRIFKEKNPQFDEAAFRALDYKKGENNKC